MKKTGIPRHVRLVAKPITLKHIYPLRALFLADFHCGAWTGLQPKRFTTTDGRVMTQNPVQKMLYKQFQKIKEVADEFKVQYIFFLGDLLNGLNYRSKGHGVTCEIRDQKRMAVQLLSEIAKDRTIYIISGTKYHSIPKGEGEPEEDVAVSLRDRGFSAKYIGDMALIDLEGLKRKRRIYIAHEASAGLVSQANLMSREINWALEAIAKGKVRNVDGVFRAHLHHYVHVDHSRIHAVQVPCFAGLATYKQTIKYFFKLQPDVGAVTMFADEEGRLRIWEFLMSKEDHMKMTEQIIRVQPISSEIYIENQRDVHRQCLS